MFEGLNAIPWAYLTHAYGSAEEVPMWLRQLTSDDASVRRKAMNHLAGSICHQDWISPASAYAVPFLIELLQIPGPQNRGEILELLADIADADPLDEDTWRKNHRVPIWNVPSHINFKDAHAEAAVGLPLYIALLQDANPHVRAEAAYALTSFPERTSEACAALQAALQNEADSRVRAGFLRFLGNLSSDDTRQAGYFRTAMQDAATALARFATAVALAGILPAEPPDDAIAILIEALTRPSDELNAYGELPRTPSVWGSAMWALEQLAPSQLRFAVPTLLMQLSVAEQFRVERISRLLLYIAFHGKQEPEIGHMLPSDITAEQREILIALVHRKDSWHGYHVGKALEACGLPRKRNEMAAFLGIDAPIEQPSPSARADRSSLPDPLLPQRDEFKALFPDISIRKMEGVVTHPGEDYSVIVLNDEIRVRFALTERALDEMRVEEALLKALLRQVSLPIPIPRSNLHDQGDQRPYMSYNLLPGKPLYKEMLESVDGEDAVQRLADQLATFLHALHTFPVAKLAYIPLRAVTGREMLVALYRRVANELFPRMQPQERDSVKSRFESFLDMRSNFDIPPALVHGSFIPSNILYDARRGSISGIVHFTNAGLGDPAADFSTLLGPQGYGEGFLSRFEMAYPGAQHLLNRAQFFADALSLQGALKRLQQGGEERVMRYMTFGP